MLQQTQVSTVVPYYQRFLERFPDVAALAAAPSDAVMALWAGLGYYARARNLHACARAVVAEHGSRFPSHAAVLASLPGIGRSTAAAIAAFSNNERAAILDGNVKRVLCRTFAIEGFPGQAANERALWVLAESLLPQSEADMPAYTQGLMDLGATCCTPRRPDCPACPLSERCQARVAGRVDELPTAKPRKALPTRQANLLVVWRDEEEGGESAVLLQRRPPAGIWGGLWSLPELEAAELPGDGLRRLLGTSAAPFFCKPADPLTHVFTHFRLDIQPWIVHLPNDLKIASGRVAEADGQRWVRQRDLTDHGLPAPIRKLLVASGRGE